MESILEKIKQNEDKIKECIYEIDKLEKEKYMLNRKKKLCELFEKIYKKKYNFNDLVFNYELTQIICELNIDKTDFESSSYNVYSIDQINFCYEIPGHPGVQFGRWIIPKIIPLDTTFV